MIEFLIAALIVFLGSAFIFSIVFLIAIRMRLLPVQPKILELVDSIFSYDYFQKSNYPKKSL